MADDQANAVIFVRAPRNVVDAIKTYADSEDRTTAYYVRRLLQEHIRARQTADPPREKEHRRAC